MIKITGLWENEGKSGKYLSGYMGEAKVLIFFTQDKKNPKAPDASLYIAEGKKKEETKKEEVVEQIVEGEELPF